MHKIQSLNCTLLPFLAKQSEATMNQPIKSVIQRLRLYETHQVNIFIKQTFESSLLTAIETFGFRLGNSVCHDTHERGERFTAFMTGEKAGR